MNSKFLVCHQSENQTLIAILDENEDLNEIFVSREAALNLDETYSGKIISYHAKLKGYFVETEKGINAFLPSSKKFSTGEKVYIKIKKEARREKEATAELIDAISVNPSFIETIKQKFPFEQKELPSLEFLINEALEEKISFLNGAHITIQKTEALWSIDIDSGNSEASFEEINKKAVTLIQKQVKLKNMSGMILIDFAGTKKKEEQENLLKEIKKAFHNDNRTKIYGFSALRLLELKRKSERSDIYDLFLTKTGLKHPLYVSYLIERAVFSSKSGNIKLTIHPSQEQYLSTTIKNQVTIKFNLNIPQDYFELKEN